MAADDPHAVPGNDVEQLYAVIGGLLLRTLPGLFHITPEDAETAIYETFLCYLTSKPPSSPADWITAGAIGEARTQRDTCGDPLVAALDDSSGPTLVERALATLSEREREAVQLALFDGMSVEAIAATLTITPAYVRKLVNRATAKLRKYLEE